MTTRKNFKKKVSTITAVLLAAAMLLGATYAWRDTRQHKTNPFLATNDPHLEAMETRDVTLNNVFTPPRDWKWEADANVETPNTISVTTNPTNTTHVFVRLTLKEYMELRGAAGDSVYTDADGNSILFATWGAAGDGVGQNAGAFITKEQFENPLNNISDRTYGEFEILIGTEMVDGKEKNVYETYMTTNNTELRDGIYGKEMKKTTLETVWGGVPKAPEGVHGPQTPNEGECAYTPVIKGVDGLPGAKTPDSSVTGAESIADYVQIGWNADMMSFAEWKTAGGEWVDKWIYDATALTQAELDDKDSEAAAGWVYWGKPLERAQSTTDLITNIATIAGKDPLALLGDGNHGTIDYKLHTDMEAVSGFDDFKDGQPTITEIEKLFEPTLPAGTTADADEVAGRTAFFEKMNEHEFDTFDIRHGRYTVKNFLGGPIGGVPVNPGAVPARFGVKEIGGKYTHTLLAPEDFPKTGSAGSEKQWTFMGWASDEAKATAGNANVATFVRGAGFNPGTVDLTKQVTEFYAVWEELDA